MSDCCQPTGCTAGPAPVVDASALLPGAVDRRNRAERRRDAGKGKR
ncbi:MULTISPECIES: hypothetical protein [unclassified Modestobacter]